MRIEQVLVWAKRNRRSFDFVWRKGAPNFAQDDTFLDAQDDTFLDAQNDTPLDAQDGTFLDARDDTPLDAQNGTLLDAQDGTLLKLLREFGLLFRNGREDVLHIYRGEPQP